jgi:hypothetical protein
MNAPFKGKKVAHRSQLKTFQKYAHGKSLTSLQAKREEKEVERHKKSAALRKYAKLCKAEGIESERVNVDLGPRTNTSSTRADSDSSEIVKKRHDKDTKKNGVVSPFRKEERKALDSQRLKAEGEERRQKQQAEILEKQKQRAEARKLHLKRTNKGQPLMNNRVKDLLAKIEKRVA